MLAVVRIFGYEGPSSACSSMVAGKAGDSLRSAKCDHTSLSSAAHATRSHKIGWGCRALQERTSLLQMAGPPRLPWRPHRSATLPQTPQNLAATPRKRRAQMSSM